MTVQLQSELVLETNRRTLVSAQEAVMGSMLRPGQGSKCSILSVLADLCDMIASCISAFEGVQASACNVQQIVITCQDSLVFLHE